MKKAVVALVSVRGGEACPGEMVVRAEKKSLAQGKPERQNCSELVTDHMWERDGGERMNKCASMG